MSDIDTTEIEWETPPAPKRQDFADALRARPGDWAVFLRSANPSIAANINRGYSRSFQPAELFEARSVNVGSGLADIYVRYVGEDGAS